jgi:hypothetical protein
MRSLSMSDLSGFEYEIGRDPDEPLRISVWTAPGDDVPTMTVRIQHSPEGAGWTNLHLDGSQSYAQVLSAGPLLWRVTLTRTFPADHPLESEGFGPRLVFGTYGRARRKADERLGVWARVERKDGGGR